MEDFASWFLAPLAGFAGLTILTLAGSTMCGESNVGGPGAREDQEYSNPMNGSDDDSDEEAPAFAVKGTDEEAFSGGVNSLFAQMQADMGDAGPGDDVKIGRLGQDASAYERAEQAKAQAAADVAAAAARKEAEEAAAVALRAEQRAAKKKLTSEERLALVQQQASLRNAPKE